MPRRKKYTQYNSFLIIIVVGILLAIAVLLATIASLVPYFKTVLPGVGQTYGLTGPSVTQNSITAATATIEWTTTQQVYAILYYRPSTTNGAYSGVLAAPSPATTTVTNYKVTLTSLTPDTTYDFYIGLSTQYPVIIPPGYPSPHQSFTTLTGQGAAISDAKATIFGTTATVTWSTPTAADSMVSYWPKLLPAAIASVSNQKVVNQHLVQLSNLSAQTDYEFYVTSEDKNNVIVYNSPHRSFTTIDTTPPSINSAGLMTNTYGDKGFSKDVTGKIIAFIGWNTTELSSSQILWGETTSYDQSTTYDNTPCITHAVSLTGLEPGKTYNYRVISRDYAQNQSQINNFTFSAPRTVNSIEGPVMKACSPSPGTPTIP